MTRFLRNVLSALPLAALAVACATPGQYVASRSISTNCPNGSTFVDIVYGDSYLKVDPKANVKQNSGFELRLKPRAGFEGKQVTIEGKTAKDGWLSARGSKGDSNGKLLICVPANQALGAYYYRVRVEDVGTLDPRADVTK
jgi:hypothetical protein